MPRPPTGARYTSPTQAVILARLAANVRRLREARGWTQETCAARCGGMATYLLQLVESGSTNVTAGTMARLCDGLEVDVLEILAPATPLAKRGRGRPKTRQAE